MSLASCLYHGWVRHRRFEPVENAFTYRVFFAYLDLDELDRVFAGRWFWSASRWAIARFRRDDHFGSTGEPLSESVRNLVDEQTGSRPTGPIRMLTQLRFWGYLMNPVAFFYCFNEAGTEVESVVAEVTNTPWGERHCYVLDAATLTGAGPNTRKEFHVSPFMEMNMEYAWRVGTPSATLSMHIDEPSTPSPLSPESDIPTHSTRNSGERVRVRGQQKLADPDLANHRFSPPHPSPLPRTHGEEVGTSAGERGQSAPFDVTMSLDRREITTGELAKTLLGHPFMTGKIAAAIYWQALKLWWKGVPFVPHPNRKRERQGVSSPPITQQPRVPGASARPLTEATKSVAPNTQPQLNSTP